MDVCFLEAVPGTGFPGAPCLASHHCRACFAGGKAPAGSPVSDAAGCAGYVPAEAQWTSIGLPCRLPCPDRFRCMSGHGCLAGVLHLDPVRYASLGHALSGHTPPGLHRLARFACRLPAHMAPLAGRYGQGDRHCPVEPAFHRVRWDSLASDRLQRSASGAAETPNQADALPCPEGRASVWTDSTRFRPVLQARSARLSSEEAGRRGRGTVAFGRVFAAIAGPSLSLLSSCPAVRLLACRHA